MNKTKMKTIFSQKLCGYLLMKGFVLVNMSPNKNGNGKNVFYFNDSQDLNQAIEDYSSVSVKG